MDVLSVPLAEPAKTTRAANASPPHWLSVVTHTDPRYGGLSAAVPRGAVAVNDTGRFDVSLAAFCAPNEHKRPHGFDEAHLSFWPAGRKPWLTSQGLRRHFDQLVGEAEGVHIHGLWEASTAIASRAARTRRLPYLVSAHGMLEPWALAQKRWKKLLYAGLVERSVIENAACLVALTRAEAEQYRTFGAKGPIALIPNAVKVPEHLSPELFFESYPLLRHKRIILFLGRLHPKKGVDLLVAAWARVFQANPDAQLVLAGPDAEGTTAAVVGQIAAAAMASSVTLTGMLGEAMKWSALAAAECFVLPSFSEGLSMGVLEALGAGVPAIVTRHCNMPEVEQYGAGWVIEAKIEDLTRAFEDLLGKSPQESRTAGARGASLITSRYNPRHVAQQTADVYEYVRSGIPPLTAELLI